MPCATNVTVPPSVTVHTGVVEEVNVGLKPLVADAIEPTEKSLVPYGTGSVPV